MGFGYRDTVHPFVVAAQAARAETSGYDKKGTVSRFYEVITISSGRTRPSEVVDLEECEAPGLIGVPTFKWVFPWTEKSIEDNAKHR